MKQEETKKVDWVTHTSLIIFPISWTIGTILWGINITTLYEFMYLCFGALMSVTCIHLYAMKYIRFNNR